MKKRYLNLVPVFVMIFFFTAYVTAQETKVTVKVEKDGKVVKDTTYNFKDAEQAENALMIMDLMGADDEDMVKIHQSMSESHGDHSKTMVFISEDGKTTEIKEVSGDSLVWVSEGEHHHGEHGENVKIVKYKSDGDTDENGKVVKTKEIKVIVTSDDEDKKLEKQ